MPAALLLLLALTPPVVAPPPPRPAMRPMRRGSDDDQQPHETMRQIDVELFGEHQLLWRGTLRVGAGPGASYMQSITQAPAEQCPPLPSSGHESRETSIRINLNVFDAVSEGRPPPIIYSVDWRRPGACKGGPVRRSITIEGSVAAIKDHTDVVTGDAGLELHITAR